MPGTTRFLLAQRTDRQWTDAIQVKVGFSLLLLVILAVPTFLLLVQNSKLILYYLLYPPVPAFSLYLRYRGYEYLSSILIVVSVYAVVTWMAWLAGFDRVTLLSWWIIALLPWVMFSQKQRAGLTVLTVLPVAFSFFIHYLPAYESPLLVAEREFMLQILRISVGLGAFSCIYFLREELHKSEKLRVLENEFYHDSLHAIPLPIIIKDGITLDFIFYNQLKSQDGSVEHTGDNRSGQGDGDDESLLVDLSKVSPEVEKIAVTVTIHDAQSRGQNFGQIANAFIRVVNQDSGIEIVRFDLAEDYSTETAAPVPV